VVNAVLRNLENFDQDVDAFQVLCFVEEDKRSLPELLSVNW
jgi:hypothetical protein